MFPVRFVLIPDLVSRGIGCVVKDTAGVVGKSSEWKGSRCRKKETNLWYDYLDGILRRSQRKP